MAAAATTEKKVTATEVPQQKTKPTKYRFKLLFGMYVTTEYETKVDPESNVKVRIPRNTIYQAEPKKGVHPVIDTDIDLTQYNGQHAHMKKFEKIIGSATQTITDPTLRLEGESINAYLRRMDDMVKTARNKTEEMMKGLDKMTQEELISLATQEEIDVSACKTVGDVRQVLREGLTS